jgi:hypothetical protein
MRDAPRGPCLCRRFTDAIANWFGDVCFYKSLAGGGSAYRNHSCRRWEQDER